MLESEDRVNSQTLMKNCVFLTLTLVSLSFMYFWGCVLGMYMILISSWWNGPFMKMLSIISYNMYRPKVYFVLYWFSYASSLLDTIFMDYYFSSFCFQHTVDLKWVSYRQHIIESCNFIHFNTLCLLIVKFNLFNPFSWMQLLLRKDLFLPFCYLFSIILKYFWFLNFTIIAFFCD